MPKMKTHSGAAKRFKITGSGKVMRLRANRQHLFEHKSSSRHAAARTARFRSPRPTSREIKRLLGK